MAKLISFVIPVYDEQDGIMEFHKVLDQAIFAYGTKYNFEILYVNDGSKDNSWSMLAQIAEADPRVTLLNLSRNFGHQIAITAGLDHADGDAVIIMDADLQDPPAVALQMIRKWEEGYHVVYGKRRSRKDTWFKKITASGFYKLINRFTNFHIPENTGDFRLMDKKVVESLRKFREKNRYMRGLVAFTGFNQHALEFDRDERFAGSTHYPLSKMIRLAADGMFSFSTKPLQLIAQLGVFVSAVSFIGIAYAIIMYFIRPDITVPGWTMMIISILFTSGIQLIVLGVLGAYIGRIYTEVQNRPLYLVESVQQRTSKST